MKKNLGSIDKIIRIIAALIISALYFTGIITGILSYILLAAGGIFLLTGIIDFCPLYAILGIKTAKEK